MHIRCIFFLPCSCIICGKTRSKQRCYGAQQPPACLPACLPGWLPLPEPQYFTAFVSAIDSAVNPTPHPWKWFRILIPLPSPVHLNLNAFCKQDFMHDLRPSPSLLSSPSLFSPLAPSLTSWLTIPPKNLCGDGFSSCGLRECAVHNSSHGAGRQAGSSPSLSGLFTRFPSIRLIYVLTLLGLWEAKKHSALGEIESMRHQRGDICVSEIVTKREMGPFSVATHVFLCVKERKTEYVCQCVCGGLINTEGDCACVCVCLRLHGLSVSSCMLIESGG